MSSQKIPLFDGVMKPVGDAGGTPVTLFTPPDKNLKDGTQAFYEVHMWVVPSGDAADVYTLLASQDSAPLAAQIPWVGKAPALTFVAGLPIKMLDGYPVRGDVTIQGSFATAGAAGSVHVYGYYYRVGLGEVRQSERRFIGLKPPAGFDAGLPIPFAPTEKKVVHKFEKGRIDEISLAFVRTAFAGTGAIATLRFEDAAGVILPSTTPVTILVDNGPDSRRNPPSPYNFYQAALGGSPALPELAQISVEAAGAGSDGFTVHGYFTRR